jgi:hypothetical protein
MEEVFAEKPRVGEQHRKKHRTCAKHQGLPVFSAGPSGNGYYRQAVPRTRSQEHTSIYLSEESEMNSDLIMVYAEGSMFIGNKDYLVLKNAVHVTIVNLTARDGIISVPVLRKIGDMSMKAESYPHHSIETDNKLYVDYIKATTGLDIPERN